jgi:hypothetical protein
MENIIAKRLGLSKLLKFPAFVTSKKFKIFPLNFKRIAFFGLISG